MLSKKNILYDPQNLCLEKDFCGKIVKNIEDLNKNLKKFKVILYLSGDVGSYFHLIDLTKSNTNINIIYVIEDISTNYKEININGIISLGELPINIHDVGVFFRKMFDDRKDYYESIINEHKFQSLGISTKPGVAHRKGIYLTEVTQQGDDIKFKLLRCSTNLDGPTDNLRYTDHEIIDKLNTIRPYFFEKSADLNHVLAQIYINSEDADGKQRKAKISTHSDKTKDMPDNGLLVFCTFYKNYSNNQFHDKNLNYRKESYDYVYGKGSTILTKLRFKLKPEVNDSNMQKQFDITLYPNSVFIISLLTNRLYTHEIVPSGLNVKNIPTRMGYVVRCSNTDAIFKEGQTYICKNSNENVKLIDPFPEGISKLKDMYFIENTTTLQVDYKDKFYFSMNQGDYIKPIV